MKKILLLALFIVTLISCNNVNVKQEVDYDFSFAFLTDIHLQPELGAIDGFQMAIDCVNVLKPDFVITGGDLIMDALAAPYGRADSLYKLYISMMETFEMPVYNTMGNHEIFGIYEKSGTDPSHPEYGELMFENRIGKRYYSFNHKDWHFIILDGIEAEPGPRGAYFGKVDEAQLQWIKEDLSTVDKSTPIVISTHIPLITVMPQLRHGPLYNNIEGSVITNSQSVLSPFRRYNLKLVLQGHLHFVEEITIAEKTSFITGGAVCGTWWNTPENSVIQEGFVFVKVKNGEFSWEYIDYGWETLREQ